MSGLLALLDDVAAIAKVAAASVDDIAAQATKAGAKAAGALIDDAAVTPKYLTGFEPARELPMVWRIARGSIFNKLVFLLPVGLALNEFAPWMVAPLLMLGGAYLCFEGAEKVAHALGFGAEHGGPDGSHPTGPPGHLEEQRVRGAIKTDFILSAEIMTIALAAIPQTTFWMEAATLATVAVGITAVVYGAVALIVKADDLGLLMAAKGRLGLTRGLGRGIVRAMPGFMKLLVVVGTAAMLWVGGSIVIHGLSELGWHWPEEVIHHWSVALAQLAPLSWQGAMAWLGKAALDGLLGLALGVVLIPLGTKLVGPMWTAVFGGKA
ncbi:MAG: DUF808 domain-containing protein [Rhodobacteraceae bacterium]|nr:MAG: DUF808 domain-containing protein [Paracoccaceae bacterium]